LVYFSLYPPSGIIFNIIHNFLEIMFPIDVLRLSEFRTMRNHLSETLMLNDIQIISDYISKWVVLKRRVGSVTSQRVLKVLFYVNILQRFFVVENVTADPFSHKYRLSSIICDVASFRLFKPIRSEPLHENNRKYNWNYAPLLVVYNNFVLSSSLTYQKIRNKTNITRRVPPLEQKLLSV
jgi:hypothetical protein